VRKIRLLSDIPGVAPADIKLSAIPGRQTFKIDPMPADNLTVQLVDWDPSIQGALLSVANLHITVARTDDFHRRVHPLLNPALLVSYPRDPGGILLCQIRPKPIAPTTRPAPLGQTQWLTAQEAKKQALLAHLLQGLMAPNPPKQ
jgi:hypothetical protein